MHQIREVIYGAPAGVLKVPWPPLAFSLASLWPLAASLWLPWPTFEIALGTLWPPWGSLWALLASA